ncbi:unnamed protein product [Lathyrus oleraceus]
MAKIFFLTIVVIAFIFSVIAITNGENKPRRCVAYGDGECMREACGKWCTQSHSGNGTCVGTNIDPTNPEYKCLCVCIYYCTS